MEWNLIIAIISIVSIIVSIILAVFNDYFKSFFRPNLTIEFSEEMGQYAVWNMRKEEKYPNNIGCVENVENQTRVVFYHLNIINKSRIPAKNCKVLLREISTKKRNKKFHNAFINIEQQYVWAPHEQTPKLITITKQNEGVIDFGYINEKSEKFIPRLYVNSNAFPGFLYKNETKQYHLEIVADNYLSRRFIFQVKWNGNWSDNKKKMERNLIIKNITPLSK
ncbi:hypothetical protein M2459_002501 [Parabacteroides sp. PF5-5]|uniref:hypothetical protein n=1 Tax=unclassified Parabacteroides TaxID=2649774 RepID=UPI002472FF7F|nr:MULTISPECIES: hypothetical protein [unclassified Parabacteroides]MDH6305743.1 hypothetical protein [Parabacteroides sp. PH5-39]MDH6316815.1 hypothetical protein [Parabacteroides sp. PF5-13]MDH6320456.1 hypothetical protein [Parabacteroides sp. PH5-13]MDH6324186.1 hypothetical protein [Parabacteroides sp. PH5-8]MDH6328001.1 hypothetical protein [Parabacteroides sp. PH5-41]